MAREPFGTRLRSLRERAGLSQAQLAEKVGTDQTHVSRWERNVAAPDLATVRQLAAALGVYAVELLIGSRPKPRDWGRGGAAETPRPAGTLPEFLVKSGVPKTRRGTNAPTDQAAEENWQEAQERVLLQEYRIANGKNAQSKEEAGRWFTGLPLPERDRIGRRLNDPTIVGRYLQTPRIHKPH
jgi:transcriptional regulator with XRE-family HTH domain